MAALVAFAAPPCIEANSELQNAIEVVRSVYQTDRQALLAESLQLTEKEDAALGPLYRRYRADVGKLGDDLVKVVLEYAEVDPGVTEDRARSLLKQYTALEKKLVDQRAGYRRRAAKVLRWAQLENRLDLALRLQLAGSIPIIPGEKRKRCTTPQIKTGQFMPSKLLPLRFLVLLGSLLALAGPGCKSATGPASASFASVNIQGHSVQEIADVTAQVFREDGYSGGTLSGSQMVFQKEGSRSNNLAYEGFVGSYYGAQTLHRVRAEIVTLGGNSYRLQCQAYIVKGVGDAFFEEEQRLTNVRSGPYRSLLKKVAERLK